MSELKPCPFCGSEAAGYEWSDDDDLEEGEPHADGAYCAVKVKHKDDCLLALGEFSMWIAKTEEEAAEIWNTRSERTCHWEWSVFGSEPDTWEGWNCSVCGEMGDELSEIPNFCPSCGAKVIDE